MKKLVHQLKSKWKINNNFDFFLIMLIFSLAGCLVTVCRKPLFHVLGFDQAPLWEKILFSLFLVMPLYQVFLLFFAILLGKFEFFWEKEKRLGRFLWRIIMRQEWRS